MHKPGCNKIWVRVRPQRLGWTNADETGIIDHQNVVQGLAASHITSTPGGSSVIAPSDVRYARYILPEYDEDVWYLADPTRVDYDEQ